MCGRGVMAAAIDLGSIGVIRAGSSPVARTIGNRRSLLSGKEARRPFFFSAKVKYGFEFQALPNGNAHGKGRYPCGCGDGHKGRNHADYLCRCNCGREVIFSGDEATKHPYPCGCTPRPQIRQIPSSSNRNFLGYTSNQQNYHIPNILS